MERAKTILVIEDEPDIILGLTDALGFEGFRVLAASTGRAGIEIAQKQAPDAILLDLMLPDINGYQVCEELRRHDDRVPIIMLTARGQESDKIRGLDAGADDYVTKPFGVGELVARVRAIFRRTARSAGFVRIEIGPLVVNLNTHSVEKDGEAVASLSFYEVELLRLLHERLGEPVSRDEILNRVWGIDASPTNRTIDNFIVKLRKKLEKRPDKPEHILTVYGFGYKLVL